MRGPLRPAAVLALAAAAGCADRAGESPTPAHYEWPDHLAFRIEHVIQLQRDSQVVQRYDVHKILRLAVREGEFILGYDSVIKVSEVPGAGRVRAPYLPEDTLVFYVQLGRRGEIHSLTAACDPAVPECAAVLPSGVAMELRRIVPGLPVWPVPPAGSWVDTLAFDDMARAGGSRGSVVTFYGPVRDTAMGGIGYWMVPWRSERHAFRRTEDGAGLLPEQPTANDGLTLIEKARLLPAFSTWLGAMAAPPGLRAIGVDASGFRARAYLVGSPFDSAFAPERRR